MASGGAGVLGSGGGVDKVRAGRRELRRSGADPLIA